jgi:allantoin racemase
LNVRVIIPVSTDKWDACVEAAYNRIKNAETIIGLRHLDSGPEAIQSEYDEARAAAWTLTQVAQALNEGVEGIIIYCFSDPGLYGAREISTVPIVGIGESSQLIAMSLADRIGILTTLPQSVPRIRRKVQARGFLSRFPSIRALDIPVLEYDQTERVTERAFDVIKGMVKDDGVEGIILGCGALIGMEKRVEEAFGIPVVEPGAAALKHLELLCSLALSQSKRSYMTPVPVTTRGDF